MQFRRRRRLLIPSLAGALLLLGAGLAGYLTAPAAHLILPAPEKPAPAANVVHGTVQSSSTASVTLATATGPIDVNLSPQTVFESLVPATVSDILPGDWLNAGAVPNRQTLFAITGLALIPADRLKVAP